MKLTKHVTYQSDEGFTFHNEPLDGTVTITKTPAGFEARYLVQDELAEMDTPDQTGDNSLFLVHYHRDFDVRHDKVIRQENVRQWYQGNRIEQEAVYWLFPVSAYIHSGVRLALGSGRHFPDYQWDVSHVGCALVSKTEWPTKAAAEKAAQSLIEEWNSYLSGDVYCLVKETYTADKTPVDYDIVGGYVGHEYALKALKTDL